MRSALSLAVMLGLVTLFGCTSEGPGTSSGPATVAEPDQPDALFTATKQAFESGQPEVVWNTLPASYQKDITSLVHQFGENMDVEVYERAVGIVSKLVKVLDEKRDFILSPTGFMAQNPMVNLEDARKNWTSTVKFFDTLIKSEIKSLDQVKTMDVEKFLSGTGSSVLSHALAAGASAGQEFADGMDKIRGTKTSVVETDGNTATVRILAPGEPAEDEVFVKVEDRWVPKTLADEWGQNMQEAQQALAAVKMTDEARAQFGMVAGMVDGALDQLLAANSEQEFAQAMQGIMGMVMPMMMGGGQGGPGGPKPGGAGGW